MFLDKYNIAEDISKKIKNAKKMKYKYNSILNIINLIEKLEDKTNNKITYTYEYEHYNKIKKVSETLYMYIIINKRMSEIFKNPEITQYFDDATYQAVPPTLRKFKLYIINGFNILEKHTRIGAFILIPNETETTYYYMFYNLKNNHGFNPKLYTLDFNKASCNAIKNVFLNIYLIKCYYH